MRRPTLIAVLLAAALAAVVPATAAARAPRCEDKAGDTLVRTAKTRVFQRVRGTIDDGQTVWLYSCRPRSRTARRVDTWRNSLDGLLRITAAQVGGDRWLVLSLDEETGTSDSFDVFAYDLTASGRTFAFARDGAEDAQVAVTRDGAIALLDGGAVRAFDASGSHVFEPAGATDLAAGGDTVYWTAAGVIRATTPTGHPTSSGFVS
jgi:hypothetical protein